MEFIKLSVDNLEQEHICCAISNNKDDQVQAKKAWLKDRLAEGLVFLKGNVRGKCFIEYLPSEVAWMPIIAPGYMVIDCLWVAGKYKGEGYSNRLLEECIKDSVEKGKKGLVILSSKKKRGFLCDESYLMHKGFQIVDHAEPDFDLLCLPFTKTSEQPQFATSVHAGIHPNALEGFHIFYTKQCPFTAKYVPLLETVAQQHNIPFHATLISTREQAQQAVCPFTAFSLYYQGNFITHEILSEKKFLNLIDQVYGT